MSKNDIPKMKITRYGEGVGDFWGYIEPEDLSWIIYFDEDGKPSHYYKERGTNGAVVEDSLVMLN
jgi:hypothetical protein